MEWAQETIQRLRQFWDEGISTAEIGRRLGVSKNAVVGKAHRLYLTKRKSPIKRRADGTSSLVYNAPRRTSGPTLPPLPSMSAALFSIRASVPVRVPTQKVYGEQVYRIPPPAEPKAEKYGRVIPCCWPIGEPGTNSFRMCDDPSAPGRSYCSEHYAKSVSRRPKQELKDAA